MEEAIKEINGWIDANWGWISYALIPIISGIIGWGTNVIALKMTFYPLEAWGWPPYFGWQGIIPSKAASMAEKSVHLMTTKLVDIEEIFGQVAPKKVAQEMQPELYRLTEKIVDGIMRSQAPAMWRNMPDRLKQEIIQKVSLDMPDAVAGIMQDIKTNIKTLFNLKGMVIDALVKDKNLLNRIFLECGEKEFTFIEVSGFYFGLLFGLPQMVWWYFYQGWWVLPTAGLVVGYLTNYLALKVIFSPVKPVRILGWELQGLFLKRQQEVAKVYARIISEEILTTKKIFDAILEGETAGQLVLIIEKHVDETMNRTIGKGKEPLEFLMGKKGHEVARNIAMSCILEDMRVSIHNIHGYAKEALDLENVLSSKMAGLTSIEFRDFLRPVFQEDEMKLIIVGAILGFWAGLAQLYFMF